MKIRSYLSLLLVLLGTTIGFAQTQLSGIVTGADGVPIPGASVLVQGTNNGTTTDFDGNFTVSVETNQSIEISYVGYVNQLIQFTGQDSINVVLTRRPQRIGRNCCDGLRYS